MSSGSVRIAEAHATRKATKSATRLIDDPKIIAISLMLAQNERKRGKGGKERRGEGE
jgi:hypothetical protein